MTGIVMQQSGILLETGQQYFLVSFHSSRLLRDTRRAAETPTSIVMLLRDTLRFRIAHCLLDEVKI